ncbi:S-methyl-5-thioribose-1-phosphate isomerase [Rhodothalassium salexigens]|uniref:S-methyl-5-thioribose-1-phosphate isomerase n=1 Tax=Rhodothalassium salexigens TaxID=1086 RepID=UPI001911D642|nr:S-methyl-5-thioribose-1-phosphate isomerase [Rhodothalassium salexigens]MBK5920038.1 S-methyl-5-thioribose-1-phosphate isomerase [Rhodothalassium salexigens]
MKIDGTPYRTIWPAADGQGVEIIDQRLLPHALQIITLRTVDDAAVAIRDMAVRGAPLIGATAAYGMALAMRADAGDRHLGEAYQHLLATRPTAINLRWALDRVRTHLADEAPTMREEAAFALAAQIADEDVETNRLIGVHGLTLIEQIAKSKPEGQAVNILTHCNAGWLATVDWGTATSPIYQAHEKGIPVHVWVDETRPRNQGAALTAWELGQHGVPHAVIPDNAGGHLMQHGAVDLCIVGTDRTTAAGDVCNKIGTYLKALAAYDNGVPFYVALPGSTIDWTLHDGVADIPIEQRDAREVTHITGRTDADTVETVRITPETSPAVNYGFDVTPARLVTALITERGICPATQQGLASCFGRAQAAE